MQDEQRAERGDETDDPAGLGNPEVEPAPISVWTGNLAIRQTCGNQRDRANAGTRASEPERAKISALPRAFVIETVTMPVVHGPATLVAALETPGNKLAVGVAVTIRPFASTDPVRMPDGGAEPGLVADAPKALPGPPPPNGLGLAKAITMGQPTHGAGEAPRSATSALPKTRLPIGPPN